MFGLFFPAGFFWGGGVRLLREWCPECRRPLVRALIFLPDSTPRDPKWFCHSLNFCCLCPNRCIFLSRGLLWHPWHPLQSFWLSTGVWIRSGKHTTVDNTLHMSFKHDVNENHWELLLLTRDHISFEIHVILIPAWENFPPLCGDLYLQFVLQLCETKLEICIAGWTIPCGYLVGYTVSWFHHAPGNTDNLFWPRKKTNQSLQWALLKQIRICKCSECFL